MLRLFRPAPLIISGLALVSIYTLAGFLLVPYVIKAYLLPKVSEQIKRPVLVKDVEFNPYVLSLRLTDLEVQESDSTPLIGFQEFFVNFQTVSIFRRAYVFGEIRLAMPYVSARVAKNGHVNLADLMPREDPAGSQTSTRGSDEPSAIPAVEIERFEIAQGIVEFHDESKAKPTSIDMVPINLVLNNFHTRPGGDNTYAFTAELGKDEILDWKGTVSIEPMRSEGTLSLTGVKIATLFQYVQERFNFDIPAGTIRATGRYRFDAGASPIDFEVSDTILRFADIRVIEKGDPEPVMTVPALDIEGIHVDLGRRTLSVATIGLRDATDRVWRNSDGSLNLQSLFTPTTTAEDAEPATGPNAGSAAVPPWTVSIGNVDVTNHTIHFEDRSLSLPMRAHVTNLSAKSRDIMFPWKHPIPLTVDHTLNETGKVSVDGQIVAAPFQLDMVLALSNIAIQPFQPYLERFARVAVDNGALDLDGKVHLAVEHPNAPLMTFAGNAGIKTLAIADRDQGSPILSWQHFQLRQIALALEPTSVTIKEVSLNQPTVHLAIHPDGEMNLATLLAGESPPVAAEPAIGQKHRPSPSVTIDTIKVLKGTATFRDDSLTPSVQSGLYDLTGSVKGLSSKPAAKAVLDLSGKVDRMAPLKIAGTINPLAENAAIDLAIKSDNIDLTMATSYSGKYVGYPIRKGKLFLNLAYKVSQKHLEAENKVAVDQLTFGEKMDSPDATSLPVPLAVALLKDRQGRIDIDLPIRGDLSDPDFKYGKVVISTLLNLMSRMVASPFSLMAKLVPGGSDGQELQHLTFEPGSSVIPPAEMKKIDAIMKGLEERPGLRLEITGTADPARDRRAVAHQKVYEQLRARWRQESGGTHEGDVPPAEEARLITALFNQWRSQRPPSPQQPEASAGALTTEEMRNKLVESITVEDEVLRALARTRAEHVQAQLVGDGKLGEERVFLTEIGLAESDHDKVQSHLNITAEAS